MKIALGVTGGIAAYKAAEIVRLLQDRGIRVQVVMTRAAQEFIRPLTFAALSGEKVITSMFASGEEQTPNIDSAIEHIAVAQSIDALLVAPATADVIAHFVQGYVASAPFQRVWEEVRHVEPELAPVHRDLTRALTHAVEESLREAQTSGLVRTDFDPAETARALTAMADRYCYLAFVFDPPESGAPSPDDAIDLLTTLWANAIALVEP